MTKQSISIEASEIRRGDTFLGRKVGTVFKSASYVSAPDEGNAPLLLIDLGAEVVFYIASNEHVTVEREVKPVRYKEGSVAVLAHTGRTIVRRSGDWMLTTTQATYWDLPEGDAYVQNPESDWKIVYGGPEEQA